MPERSLGDAAEPDEGDRLDPTTYDVLDFAVGKRPGRQSVTIEPRPALYPDLQAVVADIEAADDDADVDDLIDRFEKLKRAMRVTFVLERRSPEWVKQQTNEKLDEMGAPRNGAKDVVDGSFTERQAVEVSAHLILGQLVETSDGHDWTADDLLDLYDAAPEQMDRLAATLLEVNAGRAEGLDLDFSQRRSTSRGTRRSSTD